MTTLSQIQNTPTTSFKAALAPLGTIWDVVARRIRHLALTSAERAFLTGLQEASAQVARHVLDAEDRADLESALDAIVDAEELWHARDLMLTHTLEGRSLYGRPDAEDDPKGEGFAAFLEDVLGSGMRTQAVRIGRCLAASVVLQNNAIQRLRDSDGPQTLHSAAIQPDKGYTAWALERAFEPSVPRFIRRGVVAAIQGDALLLSLLHIAFERKHHPRGVLLAPQPWLALAMADALVVRTEHVLALQTTLALMLAQHEGHPLELPPDLPISMPNLQEIEAQERALHRRAQAMFAAARAGNNAPFGAPLLDD